MPSLTVVFSSDTDICFSPGLYGDCLPTGCNRRGRGFIPGTALVFPLHARTPGSGQAPTCGGGMCHIDTMAIVKVT
ncbi:hypothetical protein E2C00_16190 [Streptomyces sp. WAC05374]|nr:hypothetical protein EF905_01090 [Streptomyces sp. WAC05374]TDF48587.1 hypothetical protein E2B92_06915 [Streptomyces sp. WAC05374]TDF54857.1 hypothetical protein E2C02_15465 [Streptomyces sp. WAC05374]TDF55521.1 hypothetical protein E2C00_16190 [Streptomyces sp. WAC05374]